MSYDFAPSTREKISLNKFPNGANLKRVSITVNLVHATATDTVMAHLWKDFQA